MNWIDCIVPIWYCQTESKPNAWARARKSTTPPVALCYDCVGIHYVLKQWGNRASNVIKPIRMIQIDLIPLFHWANALWFIVRTLSLSLSHRMYIEKMY